MALRRWQLTVVTNTATTRPHHRLMPVQMYLRLQLVPQLVMLRTLHPATQQLDLLDPAYEPSQPNDMIAYCTTNTTTTTSTYSFSHCHYLYCHCYCNYYFQISFKG